MLGGESPDGKIHFPLISKGERFIICKGKCLERESIEECFQGD
jgi:hypothetical protein